jgi:hypothetical protein
MHRPRTALDNRAEQRIWMDNAFSQLTLIQALASKPNYECWPSGPARATKTRCATVDDQTPDKRSALAQHSFSTRSALASFEARIGLVDDIDPALAAYQTIVAMATTQ